MVLSGRGDGEKPFICTLTRQDHQLQRLLKIATGGLVYFLTEKGSLIQRGSLTRSSELQPQDDIVFVSNDQNLKH